MKFINQLNLPRKSASDIAKNIKTLSVKQVENILTPSKPRVNPPNLCEYLQGDTLNTRLFFDSDQYYDDKPDDTEINRVFKNFKANIDKFMEGQDGFDMGDVRFAERHGMVNHNGQKYKVPFRAFIITWTTHYAKMGDLIEIRELKGEKDGMLQENYDGRVLIPIEATAPLSDYIIQFLNGNEKMLDLTKFVKEKEKTVHVNIPPVPSVIVRPSKLNEESDKTVISLLDMLKLERWDDYKQWVDLAILLKNVAGEAYYGIWLKFSQTSGKFVSESEARNTWESAANGPYHGKPLGLGSLRSWAKTDNLLSYQNLVANSDDRRWMNGDLGLSKIAADLCKDEMRYDPDQKIWYHFEREAAKWRIVREATAKSVISDALRLCLYTVRADISGQVAEADTVDNRSRMEGIMDKLNTTIKYVQDNRGVRNILSMGQDKLNTTIKYVQDNRGVRNILSMGQDHFAETGFAMKLDTKKELLGVKNGVIDLRTGQLRAANPDDMVCREVDICYDPNADTTFVSQMIGEIMAEDEEMIDFLQRLLGYGMTGEVNEEIFVFFNAGGRNGKSLLLNAIEDLFRNSGFFVDGNMGLLVDRRVANIDAERAKINGSRYLIFNELKPDDVISLDNFKALSGGDCLPAAAKYGSPFSIIPYHLPICATNSMPTLPIVDVATAQRVICVEFPVTFVQLDPGEQPTRFRRQQDNNLKRKIAGHKSGLLTWLVQGAKDWYKSGSLKQNAPEKVKSFTKSYLHDQDDIEQFLNEYYERGEGFRESTADVLALYNSVHETPLKAGQLASKMTSKGIRKASGRPTASSGSVVQCYHGIRLKTE